jgi:hypothetical protein
MTAKADRRQLILTRLMTILSGLVVELTDGTTIAAGNIVHNRDELPAEKVPGIILLDADEVRDPRFPPNQGRSERTGPGMMRMTPEIYVVLEVRKGALQNKNVGEDLNLARAAILKLIVHDAALAKFTGSGGAITYDACYTDLARNRQMKGQMGLSITFGYPFIPDEFLTA